MRLDSLKKSILDMQWEELVTLHTAIRNTRLTSKRPTTKAKASRIAITKGVRNTIEQATPEELERMIALLEGEC